VLGDQLSDGLSALRGLDASVDVVLMAEVRDEATYVKHHKQKIALVFAAMRKFAARLEGRGVTVRYVRIDDPASTGSIAGELGRALAEQPFGDVVMTECGEWRLAEALLAFTKLTKVQVEIREDDRFIGSLARFNRWAADKKTLTMEFFYREMRRETGLLMDGGDPAGGQWNFDKDNRSGLARGVVPPRRLRIPPGAVTLGAVADV